MFNPLGVRMRIRSLIMYLFTLFIVTSSVTAEAKEVKALADLDVTVSSPTDKYDPGEDAVIKVQIKNKTSKDVRNIKLQTNFDGLMVDTPTGSINAVTQVKNSAKTDCTNGCSTGITGTVSGNLDVKTAWLQGGKSLTYTIKLKIAKEATANDLVITKDMIQVGQGYINSVKPTVDYTLTRYLPKLALDIKRTSPTYNTKSKVAYTLSIKNDGGSAYGYSFINDLENIETEIANDLQKDVWNHNDILRKNIFSTMKVTARTIENDAETDIKIGDTNIQGAMDLPSNANKDGGILTVTVEVEFEPYIVGDVLNKFTVSDSENNQIETYTETVPATADLVEKSEPEISTRKEYISDQYTPGQEIKIEYEISNDDPKRFANNISLLDTIMTCDVAGQMNGNDEAPYEYWYVTEVKEIQKQDKGSDAGSEVNGYNSHQTNDIKFTVDLAPKSKVVYTIMAKVKESTIGTIHGIDCGDDFAEISSGISQPDGKIQIIKTVDKSEFSPGEELTYTVKLKNPSSGMLQDVNIIDDLGSLTATTADGKSVYPFVAGSESMAVDDTQTGSHSDADLTHVLDSNGEKKLDVHALVFPDEQVVYTIKAKTRSDIVSTITNKVTAEDTGNGNKGSSIVNSKPYESDAKIEKSVDQGSYGNKADYLTWTIKATNPAPSGPLYNAHIKDEISTIMVEPLDDYANGTTIKAFTEWTYDVTVAGGAEVVTAPVDNKDLDAVVNIPSDGSVTITIKAKLNKTATVVPATAISNSAVLTDSNATTVIDNSGATSNPQIPRVRLRKFVDQTSYEPNSIYDYTITIDSYNTDGYVNDGKIYDDLASLGIFKEWKVWFETTNKQGENPDGVSTVYGMGRKENTTDWQTNNINNVFDLVPGEFITIHIKAKTKETLPSDICVVTNRAIVDDNRGAEYKAEATMDSKTCGGVSHQQVAIYKWGDEDKTYYKPGEDFTWHVKVVNLNKYPVKLLKVIDVLDKVETTFANKGDGTADDFTTSDLSPYTSWTITRYEVNQQTQEIIPSTATILDANKNLYDVVPILYGAGTKPGSNKASAYQYDIKAVINDGVVSKDLINTARVEYEDQVTGQQSIEATASVKRSIAANYVVRKVSRNTYTPTDKVTYEINVSSDVGYANNIEINEIINNVMVDVIAAGGKLENQKVFEFFRDGGHGSLAHDIDWDLESHFVKRTDHDSIVPQTAKDNPARSISPYEILQSRKDVQTTVDVGPGDTLSIQVDSIVRRDAYGVIDFAQAHGGHSSKYDDNLEINPLSEKLILEKSTLEKNYVPGGIVNYVLTIKNEGKRHANGLDIIDNFGDILSDDINGSKTPAFESIDPATIKVAIDPGKTPWVEQFFDPGQFSVTGNNFKTENAQIPIGGTLKIIIPAKTSPDDVGEIKNTFEVNGNTTDVIITPEKTKFSGKKEILEYQDKDHNKLKNQSGYTPGGWIKYRIYIENKSAANVDDLRIIDTLSEITTDSVYGGNEIPAFTEVKVTNTADGTVHTDDLDYTHDFRPAGDASGRDHVEFEILAKVDDRAIGNIKNVAHLRYGKAGSNDKDIVTYSAPTSPMQEAKPKITKQAYYRGETGDGNEINQGYINPGDQITYKLTVKNNGWGTEFGGSITDQLSTIIGVISETPGSVRNPKDLLLENITITGIERDGAITDIKNDITGPNPADIDEEIVVSPQGALTVWIDADIRKDVISDVRNILKYKNMSSKAELLYFIPDIIVEKRVKSVAGQPFSSSTVYHPGDEVVYELIITNKNDYWADNLKITDNIGEIMVKQPGSDDSVPAFDHWDVKRTITGGKPGFPDSFFQKQDPSFSDQNIDEEVDLAPKTVVTYEIKGVVQDNAIGTIPPNIAHADVKDVGDLTAKSEEIPSEIADFDITKSADKTTYLPGEVITYTIAVTNKTESWIDNLTIKDELIGKQAQIASADGVVMGDAFSDVVIEATDLGDSVIEVNNGGYGTIDIIADIAPEQTVILTAKATVALNVIGDIENIANAVDENGLSKDSDNIIVTPIAGDFEITKESDISEYLPGQEVTYTITVANNTDSWASAITLEDDLTAVVAEIASNNAGDTDNAYDYAKAEIIAGSEIVGANSFLTIDSPIVDGKITGLATIAPKESVSFQFKVPVADNVVGDVTNIVKGINDSGSKDADDTITAALGDVEIEKTVDKPTFTPGQEVTYTVEVSNPTDAWANDVEIIDDITGIKANISGTPDAGMMRQDNAFVASSVKVSFDSKDGFIHQVDNKTATADVAPKSSVKMILKAKVSDNIVGDIENIAYANGKDSNVVITPEKATLKIEKTALSDKYYAGGEVLWQVSITNESSAFANDVQFEDNLTKVILPGDQNKPVQAYSYWQTTFDASNPLTRVMDNHSHNRAYSVLPDQQDIDATIDLAPFDTVIFTIKATTNEHLMAEEIQNIASIDYDGKSQDDDAVIGRYPFEYLTHKTPLNDTYIAGERVAFKIEVNNIGSQKITQLPLEDRIDEVMVKYADGRMGPAFVPGTFTNDPDLSQSKGCEFWEHSVPMNEGAWLLNIDHKGKCTVIVSAVVNPNAVGPINNIAHAGDDIIPTDPPIIQELPDVTAEIHALNEYYTPDGDVTYQLTVSNAQGAGYAANVAVKTLFSETKGMWMGDTAEMDHLAFKPTWHITSETFGEGSTAGHFEDGKEIQTTSNIAPGGKVVYTITTHVESEMISIINVDALYSPSFHNGRALKKTEVKTISAEPVPPVLPEFDVVKTVEKSSYTNDDVQVHYDLSVVNTSASNAPGTHLFDDISSLKGKHGDVFSDWTIKIQEIDEGVAQPAEVIKGNQTNKKVLDKVVDLKSNKRNSYKISIDATINKSLDDDITNTFLVDWKSEIIPNSPVVKAEDSATTHITKYPDNTGDLKLTKTVSKSTAQVGDVVEYEVIVSNDNVSLFTGVEVVDHYPAGFKYVPDSTQMVHSGPDGEFDTDDDTVIKGEPSLTNRLVFKTVELLPNEKVRIRYLMRVSVGVTFGKYVNTAVAQVRGENASNVDKAVVAIQGDKVFDTASIIGKVFEDLNGDGFQADATSHNIQLKTEAIESYIPGTTTLKVGDKQTSLEDKKSSPTYGGVTIKELVGLSENRTLDKPNKAVIRFKTRESTPFSFKVSSQYGTEIKFDNKNSHKVLKTGDVKQGLSAEKLNVIRNLYKSGDDFLWEIIIENKGVYEEGIPGVRLITTEGIKAETDQFGRYHIPDQWVLDKKGKNFLVKLDSDSLPTGMKVISENPKVQRITPNKLTKFNFSVQVKEKQ